MRRNAILLLSMAIAVCAARSAQASEIYYTESAKGVYGTINGKSFGPEPVTFHFHTDTKTNVEVSYPFYLQSVTGTVTIGGIGAATLTVPGGIVAFDDQLCTFNTNLWCLAGLGVPHNGMHGLALVIFETKNNKQFANYKLDSNFGPVFGPGFAGPGTFSTSRGGLTINSVKGGSYFAARCYPSCTAPMGTISSTPTPEPSSLALFGAGVLGMGGLIRRKLTA